VIGVRPIYTVELLVFASLVSDAVWSLRSLTVCVSLKDGLEPVHRVVW
jgi:hypothetical protein